MAEARQANQDEYIIVSTDADSIQLRLMTLILRELRERNRLHILSTRATSIGTFVNTNGGEFYEDNRRGHLSFARSLHSTLRAAMLSGTEVPVEQWPGFEALQPNRNRPENFVHFPVPAQFTLDQLNNPHPKHYYSKYDQQFPHTYIEEQLRNAGVGNQAPLQGMMLIIDRDFSHLVEIVTNGEARVRQDINEQGRRITSRFSVTVSRCEILEHGNREIDGPWMAYLRALAGEEDEERVNNFLPRHRQDHGQDPEDDDAGDDDAGDDDAGDDDADDVLGDEFDKLHIGKSGK